MILSQEVMLQVIADHDLISVTIDVCKPKRQPDMKTYRHLANYNDGIFCSAVLYKPPELNKILSTDDVNMQVKNFKHIIMESLSECAPFVTKIVRRPPAPWMTDDIKLMIEVRNSLQNHLKNDRHNTNGRV